MKLTINGESYDVPRAYEEKLMGDLLEQGRQDYEQRLDKKWRVIAMAPARLLLSAIEKHVAKQSGPEAAAVIRPGKDDPVLHLGWVMSRVLLEGLKHVTLHIDTDGQGTVSAFHLDIEGVSQAGRLVGLDRSAGSGQVNGAEIP